jgi:hypothetical protein
MKKHGLTKPPHEVINETQNWDFIVKKDML